MIWLDPRFICICFAIVWGVLMGASIVAGSDHETELIVMNVWIAASFAASGRGGE